MLENRTDFGRIGVGAVAFGVFARWYLKKLSCISGNPSNAGKFWAAQKAL